MSVLKNVIAGAGAWKLGGGGCLGTIIAFMLIYWLLGALGMQ